ncbi:TraL conjugative transposon family protein [Bacteroides gallinaceum]|uniref:TraL conjugative transposon family protein n=1 Tax=Bacteroides gallinaceum TaxID=1462571 RepID=UPI0025AADD28|nr:TraL conjugative transposon family protein [Bacteroides gallinaceum]MDN0066723.1 TraL conjugative transposon family protein [Bacteroides gallinaceum]
MNRRRNFWKRADIRLRMSCRKLTERQRAAVLLALFLPFLAGCVYTVGTALQGFGERDGPGPEVEHIRPIGITCGIKKMNEKEQAENRHENEHRKTQDAAEAASAQGRRQAAD